VLGTCVKLSASTTADSCSLGLASRSLLNRAGIAMLRARTEQSAVRVLLQLRDHRTLYTLLRLKPCRYRTSLDFAARLRLARNPAGYAHLACLKCLDTHTEAVTGQRSGSSYVRKGATLGRADACSASWPARKLGIGKFPRGAASPPRQPALRVLSCVLACPGRQEATSPSKVRRSPLPLLRCHTMCLCLCCWESRRLL